MRKLIVLTITCNLCILIGAGHGVAPFFVFLPTFMTSLVNSGFDLNFTGSYAERLPTAALLCLLGYIVLIAACFWRRVQRSFFIVGLFILLLALGLMALNVASGHFDGFVLLMAIPFLYASIRCVIYLVSTFRNNG